MPRVTVLMSVYNGERFLGEAVAGILSQTYTDFELLIVDDGSTDGSRALASSFEDPRIRLLVNSRNLGLARSLNRGLEVARGEYVARQDADDFSEPERLAKQVAYLDEHPETALVGSGYTEVDSDGAEIGRRELPRDYREILWSLGFYCPFVHSAVMFRRSVVPGVVGPYDESLVYSMDYELWRRVAARLPVANLGDTLVRHRTNPWSMTSTLGEHTQEGARMRAAALAELLGWDTNAPEVHRERAVALSALVTGVTAELAPDVLRTATYELMRLAVHFGRAHGLEPSERRAFRTSVHARIGSSLGEALLRGGPGFSAIETGRLASLAFRLHPSLLLRRDLIRVIVRRIIRPRRG
jgi:Glycosyl transferase family 2